MKTTSPFACLILLPVLSSFGLASPIVSIQPSLVTVQTGTSIALSINIAGITDLFAFQFDLAFDPGIVSAGSITEGSFLSSAGTTFFLPGIVDNTTGTITFTANSLIGEIPGASGSGGLAVVQLSAAGAGLSAVTLSDVQLLDSGLNPIGFAANNAIITVKGVPEPSTLWLLLSSVSVLLLGPQTRNAIRRIRSPRNLLQEKAGPEASLLGSPGVGQGAPTRTNGAQ